MDWKGKKGEEERQRERGKERERGREGETVVTSSEERQKERAQTGGGGISASLGRRGGVGTCLLKGHCTQVADQTSWA